MGMRGDGEEMVILALFFLGGWGGGGALLSLSCCVVLCLRGLDGYLRGPSTVLDQLIIGSAGYWIGLDWIGSADSWKERERYQPYL